MVEWSYKSMKIKNLDDRERSLCGFSSFTLPYQSNRGYYGIVLFIHKIIVVVLKGLVTGMIISGNLLAILIIILFYLMFYYLVFIVSTPYEKKNYKVLHLTEKRMILLHISNALILLIWILSTKFEEKFFGWLIFMYISITNLFFLIWWTFEYFSMNKGKIASIRTTLETKLSILKKNIKQRFRSFSEKNVDSNYKKDQNSEKNRQYDPLQTKICKLKLLNSLLLERIELLENFQMQNPIKANNDLSEESIKIPSENKLPNNSKIIFEKKDDVATKQASYITAPFDPQNNNRLSHFHLISNNFNTESDYLITEEKSFSDKNTKLNQKPAISDVISIIKEKDSKLDLSNDYDLESNQFKFIGKDIIGKNSQKSFLLLKYQITTDSIVLIKTTQNLSKNKNS